MMRLGLTVLVGIACGIIIHIVMILVLPDFATRDLWHRLEAVTEPAQLVVLDDLAAGDPNPLRLDPELLYGVCRFDLDDGPGVLSGTLPGSFWSVAVFDADGHVVYSTTSRANASDDLDLGIFGPSQMRLLTEQSFEVEEGLIIAEAPGDEALAVLRLAPPHPAARDRYREALADLRCLNVR
ncbi:DUF1254 domain-containing protein [Pelagibacterium montanilacus]|uniref:DUF1254 domain-containing protein n=1 Tax=Pelagibacterium montanilacus TaxID=2185280 RepID=UPI000F8DBC12|nr:DUF1254 domain-containing protein [Pelagibacterium montanilacus]